MQSSNRSFPPTPPAHAPRLSEKELQQSTLLEDVSSIAAHSQRASTQSTSVIAILTRSRAQVVPTESQPSVEEKTGVRSGIKIKPAHVTTQRALQPTEEFDILLNAKHSDTILDKVRYRSDKENIQAGINSLIFHGLCSLENQAAVIMTGKNAKLVASVLKDLRDSDITVSNNMRFALVRAGKNVGLFTYLLIQLKKYYLNIKNLADIYASVSTVTAGKLTDLLVNNPSYSITLTRGFSARSVTDELIDFVDASLRESPTMRVAAIFAKFDARVMNQHTSASENTKRSRLIASDSRLFQAGSTVAYSDANPGSQKKAAIHPSRQVI